MKVLDKYGWPVETIRGRPIQALLRRLIHGRSIVSDLEWSRREHARQLEAIDRLGQQCVAEAKEKR